MRMPSKNASGSSEDDPRNAYKRSLSKKEMRGEKKRKGDRECKCKYEWHSPLADRIENLSLGPINANARRTRVPLTARDIRSRQEIETKRRAKTLEKSHRIANSRDSRVECEKYRKSKARRTSPRRPGQEPLGRVSTCRCETSVDVRTSDTHKTECRGPNLGHARKIRAK